MVSEALLKAEDSALTVVSTFLTALCLLPLVFLTSMDSSDTWLELCATS